MTTDTEDFSHLRALAEASKQWIAAGCPVADVYDTYPQEMFHAACSEVKIIALLDKLEALQVEVARRKAEEYQLRHLLETTIIDKGQALARLAALPDTCDGKEQEAFKMFAEADHFDMQQHPLHYLFLNGETSAARQGWKAAILYCRKQLYAAAGASPVGPALKVQVNLCEQCGKVLPNTGTYGHSCDAVYRPTQPSQAQAALDAIFWYYENCTGSESSISAFQQMVDRVVKVKPKPNFCESCAMDIATCDCVTPRPVTVAVQPSQARCPTCGSDCNERDELIKAEREIERLNVQPSQAGELSDEEIDRIAHNAGIHAEPRFGFVSTGNVQMRHFARAIIAAINAKESGK